MAHHCGIPPLFLSTWLRSEWIRVDREIRTKVYLISKRIESRKIQKEKAVT